MKRRAFIAMLGGAAFGWPLPARAQQAGKVFRVGWLGVTDAPGTAVSYRQFLEALRANGFIEGENLVVETRALDDPRGPLAAGADLTRAQSDVIVAQGPEIALQAVIGASQSIPIVLQAINYDPIARGYVTSLARPGGNITGLFYRQPELAAKKLVLDERVPEHRQAGSVRKSLRQQLDLSRGSLSCRKHIGRRSDRHTTDVLLLGRVMLRLESLPRMHPR